MDDRLHLERVAPDRSKHTERANLDDLPEGVFVSLDGRDEESCLLWRDHLLVWSPEGYRRRRRRPRGEVVTVVTPASSVRAIRSGYLPEVHPSAR
jgi:hypothetical protein